MESEAELTQRPASTMLTGPWRTLPGMEGIELPADVRAFWDRFAAALAAEDHWSEPVETFSINIPNASTERLIDHWTSGPGAAQIRWGTDGSMKRCIRKLRGKVRDPGGLCAELHKRATGEWPAEKPVDS